MGSWGLWMSLRGKNVSRGVHAIGGEVLGCPVLTPCCSPAVLPAVQPDHRSGGHDAAAEGALHGGSAGAGAEGEPAPGPHPPPPGAGGLHQQLRLSHPEPLRVLRPQVRALWTHWCGPALSHGHGGGGGCLVLALFTVVRLQCLLPSTSAPRSIPGSQGCALNPPGCSLFYI